VLAHNALDVYGGFAGVVEGDGGDEVVADVGTDDIVEEVGVDEAQVPVGVLEESDGDCGAELVFFGTQRQEKVNLPIQLFTHNHGTPQSTITFQLPKT